MPWNFHGAPQDVSSRVTTPMQPQWNATSPWGTRYCNLIQHAWHFAYY